jgi:hypothetical protein
MAREYLMLVKESAFMTPKATPVVGTDAFYIRLSEGNGFEMTPNNITETIMYGGGFAVASDVISDHYELKGRLQTKLYPTQASFLLNWWLTRINSGQTSPWTTTELAGDLASVSAYHAIRQSNGVYLRKRHAGCKVASGSLEVSRDGTSATLSLDLVGARTFGCAMDSGTADPDATEFPFPTEAQYPTGPYTFTQTAGNLTIRSSRTQYQKLTFSTTNALDPKWWENPYVGSMNFYGRTATLAAELRFKASPDDRTAFEQIVDNAASFGFTNGVTGQNVTINMYSANKITGLTYQLPNNQDYLQPITLTSRWDAAAVSGAGGDLAVSFT